MNPDLETGAVEGVPEQETQRPDVIERKLAQIWADVLGIPAEQIRSEYHFFAIGGDSGLAAQVRERIMEEFSIELSIGTLFDAPKLGQLAKSIEETIEQSGMLARPGG